MVNVPKHCGNLCHSTFIIFIEHCQINWLGRNVSYWHANSWDCLLTQWLPMKSILFWVDIIERYQFRWNFSRKQKAFSKFFAAFLKSSLNFKHFEKKMTPLVFVFSKLSTPKTRLDKCLKRPVSEDPSTSNMADVPKHCWNLHHTIFIIFIDHCQVNWVGKNLSDWHAYSWDCLLTHWLPMKSILFLIEII